MPENKTIIITGASGFIGSFLCKYFAENGWNVIGLVRKLPKEEIRNVRYELFEMPNNIPLEVFKNSDAIVHCSYSKFSPSNPNSDKINKEGTEKLLEISRASSNPKFIFLSSMSAHKDALSHYGRSKFALEKIFDPNKDVILKPGLVMGNGGMLKTISEYISKHKTIPLPGNGIQPVQTLTLLNLSDAIQKIIMDKLSGTFCLGEVIPITIKEFYTEVAKQSNKNIKFISIPFWPLFMFVRFIETIGLKTSTSSESLLGLKQLKSFDTAHDLQKLGIEILDYKTNIETNFTN